MILVLSFSCCLELANLMIFVTELCNEIVIFWDYWCIAGKRGDKAESSTESEPMDATTNGAASHPKIESFFLSFFFQPPSEFWYFVQTWHSYDRSSVIKVDSSSNRKSSNLLGHWLSLVLIGCVPLAAAPSIHGLVK
jgi:hypothetical protein